MKKIWKRIGLTSLTLLLVLAFVLDASAHQRRRGTGRQRQGLGPNAQTFELEEFSPQEEQLTRQLSALRYGQYADTIDEPDPQVKAYPKLKSEKPVYGFITLDQGLFSSTRPGATFCFVVDESEGTGKGYDRFYFDLNNDFDLSNDQPLKPAPSLNTKQGRSVVASLVQNVVEIVRPQNIRRPSEVTFEALTLTLSSGRGGRGSRGGTAEIKLIPKFTRYNDRIVNVSFVPDTARHGKIKIGDKELDVVLARSPYITSRLNSPNTGLYIGTDYEIYSVLGKMRNIDGKLYRFSASRDGGQLMVAPYEGEYGLLQVGSGAGELKDAKFDGGILISRRNLIDLDDCPTDGNKIKVPVGDYRPMSLDMVSEKLGTSFYQEDTDAEDSFNLQITADRPFIFDFSHSLKVVFDSPEEMAPLKPGDQLRVSAMMHVPDLNFKMMGLDDRTKQTKTGVVRPDGTEYIRYASLDPDVKITNASGKVVAEGKMPFG